MLGRLYFAWKLLTREVYLHESCGECVFPVLDSLDPTAKRIGAMIYLRARGSNRIFGIITKQTPKRWPAQP
jgi:hypothetical protein